MVDDESSYFYGMSTPLHFKAPLILVIMLCAACSTTQKQTTAIPLQPLVGAVTNSDSSFVISVILRGDRSADAPRRVWALIGAPGSIRADSAVFRFAASGAPGAPSTVSYTASVDVVSRPMIEAGSCSIELFIETASGLYRDTIDVALSFATSLHLDPFANDVEGGIELGCMAHRLIPRPDEFLPSSEQFRVIIRDTKAMEVYRSDAGMAFMQVITPVEPRDVGAYQRFSVFWRGTTSQGQNVPSGEYVAEMIIPAVPIPYSTSIAFTWSPQ